MPAGKLYEKIYKNLNPDPNPDSFVRCRDLLIRIRTKISRIPNTNFLSINVLLLKIAAGGWHSAAISEFDDLYMFGWNESGQLALPTNLARDGTLPIKQTDLAHT